MAMPLRSKTIFASVKKWLWIGLFAVLTSSCLDQPDCLRVADQALVIGLVRLGESGTDTLFVYNIEAVSDLGAADSVFYKQPADKLDTLVGKVLVAVDPFARETSFTFHLRDGDKMLRVGYDNSIRYISEDCGTEMLQRNLTILETDFDSVRLVLDVLTKDRKPAIEIFQ